MTNSEARKRKEEADAPTLITAWDQTCSIPAPIVREINGLAGARHARWIQARNRITRGTDYRGPVADTLAAVLIGDES